MKKSGILQKIAVMIVAFLMIFLQVNSVFALSETQLDKFAQNNILFYDPGSNNCGSGAGMVSGSNQNYAGATVITEEQLKAIEANRPFYEKSAEKYGFPWQLLAVIHKREHSLMRDNPGNGEGAYQLHSYTDGGQNANAFYPAGAISDEEFQRQTDIAASVIQSKIDAAHADVTTDAGIKKTLFYYNSASTTYINQAIALGFSEADAKNGEGSPYVMNRFDEKRDPTVDPTRSNRTWGQIKSDGGSIEYPANSDFGAYVQYVAIGGTMKKKNTEPPPIKADD